MPWEKVPMASIFIITFRYTYLSAPKKLLSIKNALKAAPLGLSGNRQNGMPWKKVTQPWKKVPTAG